MHNGQKDTCIHKTQEMKTRIILLFIVLISSCSKEHQPDTKKELTLNITKNEWFTRILENDFGEIVLKIDGASISELLTIETHGDGFMGCEVIPVDSDNNFSIELVIATKPNWDTIPKRYHTYITAYEKSESPDIVFCRTGSGEQIREIIESDYLTFKRK